MSSTRGSDAGSHPRVSLEMGTASNEDLLDDKGSKGCSKKSLLLTGGLTGGVIIIVVVLVLTLGGMDDGGNSSEIKDPRPGFTLDDYLMGRFAATRFNATWVSDTHLMFTKPTGEVMQHDLFTNTTEELFSPADDPRISRSFLQQISPDGQFLLIGYDYQKIFRHTYLASYSVINRNTKVATDVLDDEGNRQLQLCKWAPTKNALAFVRGSNIFYKEAADAAVIHKLTTDGGQGIYNGVPDWVYEEEVLSSNEAMWFSPDGSKLAFATFNDKKVRNMTFPYYGKPNNISYQYPFTVYIPYPKPGSDNPVVTLNSIDLPSQTRVKGSRVAMNPPPEVGADLVLATVTWGKPNEIVVVWMNRVQNRMIIAAHDHAVGDPTAILDYQESSGWVDQFVPPMISSDGNRMLIISPQNQGAAGSFRHLTLVTRDTKATTALTRGEFVVTSIVAWDEADSKVYFQATSPNEPAQQNLYWVSDSPATQDDPVCISCGVKVTDIRQPCSYVSASFSTGKTYYNLNCNGPDVPGTLIFKKTGERVYTWEENVELAEFMSQHSAGTKKRLFVDVPGGMKAYVQMILPPDMDTSGNTKYPMLVNVYGGPDSSQVSDRFTGDWGTYLTTNRSFIYAAIDGRGSGLKGNNVLFSGYRNLGSVEIEDQINVTKYLQSQFPYIDATRTAIWGWSYGGYSTGMALAKDTSGVFRCGMSVAPVTDWIYYDSIYTERYMGLPKADDNLAGYQRASLNNIVDNLGRNPNRFLLIHGTADDNVHYQQAMLLSKTLEDKDILFMQQSYPDEQHGLSNVSPHLYHTLENFLDLCLDLPPRM